MYHLKYLLKLLCAGDAEALIYGMEYLIDLFGYWRPRGEATGGSIHLMSMI